jgi:hypothetical protein
MSLCNWGSNGPIANPAGNTRLNMEQRWNDIGRGNPKDSENDLSQCRFVYHKSYMDWTGTNTDLSDEIAATNHQSCDTAWCSRYLFSWGLGENQSQERYASGWEVCGGPTVFVCFSADFGRVTRYRAELVAKYIFQPNKVVQARLAMAKR